MEAPRLVPPRFCHGLPRCLPRLCPFSGMKHNPERDSLLWARVRPAGGLLWMHPPTPELPAGTPSDAEKASGPGTSRPPILCYEDTCRAHPVVVGCVFG